MYLKDKHQKIRWMIYSELYTKIDERRVYPDISRTKKKKYWNKIQFFLRARSYSSSFEKNLLNS